MSQSDLTSEVMSCTRIWLLPVCFVLLQAVTTTGKQCRYELKLTTGNAKYAGTDDNIYFRIRQGGYWRYLDNSGIDDFERGHTDAFTFEDDCIAKEQLSTTIASILSRGHVQILHCFTNQWLLTKVVLKTVRLPKKESWKCEFPLHAWLKRNDKKALHLY